VGHRALYRHEEIDGLKEAAREWKADCQVAGSIVHARELLEYEFKETDRLGARIAKQIKFLVELQTVQQMLRESRPGNFFPLVGVSLRELQSEFNLIDRSAASHQRE
jgi:hypothetical protein